MIRNGVFIVRLAGLILGKVELERAAGIEPACLTWKDSALPLSYARVEVRKLSLTNEGGGKRFFQILKISSRNLK